MIFALEGPDGCGKSALYRMLEKRINQAFTKFVKWGPLTGTLWEHIQLLEQRDHALFSSMYGHDHLYFCDRFCAITGPIYAKVYNRPVIPVYDGPWNPGGLVVCYIRTPLELCRDRLRRRNDEMAAISERLPLIHQAYENALDGRQHAEQVEILDGTKTTLDLFWDMVHIVTSYGSTITVAQ